MLSVTQPETGTLHGTADDSHGIILPDDTAAELRGELTQALELGLVLDLLHGDIEATSQALQEVVTADGTLASCAACRAVEVAMQATSGLAGSSIEDLTEGVERWLLREVALSECQQFLVGRLIAHRVVIREEGTATLEGLTECLALEGLDDVLRRTERSGFTALDRLAVGSGSSVGDALHTTLRKAHEESFQDFATRTTEGLQEAEVTDIEEYRGISLESLKE